MGEPDTEARLAAEQRARVIIDRQLVIAPSLVADLVAGWWPRGTRAAASASRAAQPSVSFVTMPQAGMGDETAQPEYPMGSDEWTGPYGPSNRAERRAQQAQARARRARARH